ncbi:hypothetical protein F5B18DRAFT_536268 [Nemania serpens]|nr:hypothetical protein F5B18DRAFT_536268 [Nemania serpens]
MTSTAPQTEAMSKLSLDTSSHSSSSKTKSKPKKKEALIDSWEDDESSSSEPEPEPEAEIDTDIKLPPPSVRSNSVSQDGVAAPPPTPLSPSYGRHGPDGNVGNSAPWLASSGAGREYGYGDAQNDSGARRPEKTDAVARRMIASALGVRAPRPTEEQKAYDRAVREKERKKREEEREAERRREEAAEKAKAAMWND